MPRKMRRRALKSRYNFYCECEGCLDEERNERMEGWRCRQCEDGWLPPLLNSKCSRCGWRMSQEYFVNCRSAQETAMCIHDFLVNNEIKLEVKLEMANK
ncbi:hypothetical protein OSTOST_19467, partial [Ostertagia ostertagi]